MSEYHTPVLLDESVSALITNPSGIYIDATFGGGGHTAEILSRLSPAGKVIAFDRDSDAINNRIDDPRLILIRADFRYIHNFVMLETLKGTVGNYSGGDLNAEAKVDGVLADLGVSSHQFDTADRGFSFRFDAPLDMRMNKDAEHHGGGHRQHLSAKRIGKNPQDLRRSGQCPEAGTADCQCPCGGRNQDHRRTGQCHGACTA